MSQFAKAFEPDKLQEAWHVFLTEFPMGLWETLYVTLLATLFAIVLGLPLGILLVTGDEKGIRPMPKPLMKVINVVINFLRSVPFLILIVMVIPLTRVIVGTSIGSVASIVPLVVAAFPSWRAWWNPLFGSWTPISSRWPRAWAPPPCRSSSG